MKGKPYRERITDGAGTLYSETTISYHADLDPAAPWFNPPKVVKTTVYDGNPSTSQSSGVEYVDYDAYGNVTVEDRFGAAGEKDDVVIFREFSPNLDKWIVGLPSKETIRSSRTATENLAETTFYYDGSSNCTAPSGSKTPTKGNLTRVVKWLRNPDGTDPADPEVWMGYDAFGNLTCQRDANGNVSRITYDGTNTFPIEAINPLGQKTVNEYYGVDGVAADQGLYGQLKSVTYPTLVLSDDYTLGKVTAVNHNWRTVTLPKPYAAPVVIAGPPSAYDSSPGVIRVSNITPTSFALRFQEWSYLSPAHSPETVPCLVLEQGRTTLPDGTIIEVGAFPLSGERNFIARSFTTAFPGRPAIFLTVQTNNDPVPVTVRASSATAQGFTAALFEEERYKYSGHGSETVGYLAIYNSANAGFISVSDEDIPFQIRTSQANESYSAAFPNFSFRLQEEQSFDSETTHGFEAVDLLLVGEQFFAQSIAVANWDTFALRHLASTNLGDGLNNLSPDTGITDPNPARIAFEYDVFGRKIKESRSDGFWTQWSYNNFGVVGSQHVSTDNSAGLWNDSYFNGLGKVMKDERVGPDNKVIVVDSYYDSRGLLKERTIPHYSTESVVRSQAYRYDPLGRITQITLPDLNLVRSCTNSGVTVTIDENDHRRRETRDVQGRLIKVQEYSGIFSTCTTGEGTPSTTIYDYDRLGNLLSVTDAHGNVTSMAYDTLGRKTAMVDPDMGTWSYVYDVNGNLTQQTDAKGQIIKFQYDALNRVTVKAPLGVAATLFKYDEALSHGHGIGRLTTVSDGLGGSVKYFYADPFGKTVSEERTLGGVKYAVTTSSDALGRLASVRYPDGETVVYSYDTGGNLRQAGTYAAFIDYSALGQPRTVNYGNGVKTTYGYHPTNQRLETIHATYQTTSYLNLRYEYDNKGNVKTITNSLDGTKTQTFGYDHLDRLTSAQSATYGALSYTYDKIGNFQAKEGVAYTPHTTKPHAVGFTSDGYSYSYDANGNMTSDGQRTFVWDKDNRPTSITYGGATTTFAYDGIGNRVRKTGPAGTTYYFGKLYEINGGVPAKFIFANGQRIALKSYNSTSYYHQDHLGSTGAVTNQSGIKVEDIFYKPFGGTHRDAGSVSVNHKYTGQELDAETGLYFYNARYYNPALGRFISADSIVPDPTNPQAFNKYSYVQNNPIAYIDSSGHNPLIPIVVGAIIGAIAAGAQTDWDPGAMVVGGVIGGVSGGVFSGVSGVVSNYVGSGFWGSVASGAAGGAAAGATSGGLNAAWYGGDVGQGMLQGAGYGAIAGGVGGGLVAMGVPNTIAAAGGGYTSGYAQCGSDCANEGAIYSLGASVLSNALTISGLDADGTVPARGTSELQAMQSQNNTYATTPGFQTADDILWNLIALFSGGYSHTWHSKDNYVPEGHYYKIVQSNVPYPGEAYNYKAPGTNIFTNKSGVGYNLFTNNCSTRFGYLYPAQYYSNYNYSGQGTFWWWGR